jgi:membrane protein required for colicin V production
MIVFDVILLVFLAGFVFYGLFFGLIRTIGSLLGLIGGVWVAATFYEQAYAILGNLAFGFDVLGRSLAFFLIFTIVNRLIAFGFAVLDRTFDFFSIIPFLKTINRVAGALFGLIEGGFVLGFALYIMQSYSFSTSILERFSADSKFVPYIEKFVEVLRPVLPTILDQLKHLV